MQAEKPEYESPLWTNAVLWTGFLLGPVAWATHLQFVYVAAQQACDGDLSTTTLHVVSGICLMLAVGAGALAARQWFQAGAGLPSQYEGGIAARRRFLSVEGMLTGSLFALIIAAQWLALVYFSPCPP